MNQDEIVGVAWKIYEAVANLAQEKGIDLEKESSGIGEATLLAMQMLIGCRSTALLVANAAPKPYPA